MSSALFGNTARSTSKNLAEFRAGKMVMKGKIVHPDKRKGLVYIYQSDDTLMHFCWKDRTTGNVEEDLIIFPEDCEYKKVSQCTTGRVFVLRFKSNNRRLFFWMQEPKTDKDDEYLRKVNEYLNNPPTPGSQRSTSSTPNPVLGSSDLSNLQNSDIHNFIGNISQQQLMQILGSGVPSLATLLGPKFRSIAILVCNNYILRMNGDQFTATSSAEDNFSPPSSPEQQPAASTGRSSSSSGGGSAGNRESSSTTSATTNSSATTTNTSSSVTSTKPSSASGSTPSATGRPIQLSDLENILTGIAAPPEGNERIPVDLASVMTAEALQPILTNVDFVEQLRPYMPPTSEQLPPVDELRGTITSPQFQQAVNLFTSALQSGQLGPLINQFGLGEEAVMAATSCDMEAFIKALGKNKDDKVSSKEETKKKEKDQDKDEDDSMALD